MRNRKQGTFRIRELAAVVCLAAASSVQAAVLEGRVANAGNNAGLPGAEVRIVDTGESVFTDDSGSFRLRGLAAGAVTVEISYLGLQSETEQVTLTESSPATLNVALGNSEALESILVVGQRQAASKALNLYRSSDSITNFIAADDMGQFVDQNVAESLQRLPGIAITRDQGEGRFVSVRGISAGLSTVTINGMRIGTPEDSSRAVPLDVIPTGSVEGIEVTKVPTPDMPGDAIGGSVNVRSASAFDRPERSIRYRAEASHNDLSGETSPELQFNFSDVLGSNEILGVSLGASYTRRELQSDNIEPEYDYLDRGDEEVFSLIELQNRKYYVDRERTGINLGLELRPDELSHYYFNAVYSEFKDAETRQRSIVVFEDGELTDFDGSNARYENIDEDGFRRRIRFRTKDQDTLAFNLGGEHFLGGWTLDYNLGISTTRERVLDETEGRFEMTGDPLDAEVNIGNGIATYRILDGSTPDARYLDNSNYILDRVVVEPILVDDDDTNYAVNATFDDLFGMSGFSFKTGIDGRFKEKDADVNEVELRDVPDEIFLDRFSTSRPDYALGNLGEGISSSAFLDYFAANRDQFGIRPRDEQEAVELALAEDYRAEEDVLAAYAMGTWELGRLQAIAGLRLEHTDFEATGNQLDFGVDGALSVSERSVSADYTNVLPGLHLRYEALDNLVLRAAWSNTIARPAFGDISPRSGINREELEIDMGNPELDPYESANYDLMLDWYLGESGVISAGLYYKDIDNYIVEFTSDENPAYPGFEVTMPVNGTEASVTGLEFNLQQGLERFSPSLTGFLVGANLTFLDTDLALAERSGESFDLPEAADRAANLYVGYELGRFSGRVSVTHRDEFLSEVGDDRNFDIYVSDHTQVDLTGFYWLGDQAQLVLEMTNLTDEPLELYQGSPGYTFQFEEYGPTIALGFKGQF